MNKRGFIFLIGIVIALILFIVALAMVWVLGAKAAEWFTAGGWTKYLKWGAIVLILIIFYKPIMAVLKFILGRLGIKV